ncbi:MAG: nitronate monooxygenase [Acidimicrobiales bacterium]|nr:nitronate monooxygenase [Acidimicrobiales bacterium]
MGRGSEKEGKRLMQNDVTEMLDLEFPIFAFSHCRDVVAAVSKAGGLGVLGAVAHSPEQLEIDLDWIEDEVGDKPYGVDLIIPAKYAGDDQGGYTTADLVQLIPGEHREFIDDILARYKVPPLPGKEADEESSRGQGGMARSGAAIFSANAAGPQIDVALSKKTAFVANALGPPPQHMIDAVKGAGRLVVALAGRPSHAEAHERAGVDIIIAQGSEAGGHTGEIGTMVLIPEIVEATSRPVLGAGGIGRGRQMAAAMALGAQGVWCGSVWLTTDEAETHPVVKEKFLAATSADTIRSRSLTGKHARMLRSAWTEEWDREDTPDPLDMPLQPILTAEAQARIDRSSHHAGSGAEKLANYFVGQIVGNMNQRKSATQVVMEMVEEFIEAVEGLKGYLDY